MGDQDACIDLMIWVGGQGRQVRTVDEFVREARVRGCCRKLPSVPGWAKSGETRVFLAHGDKHNSPARGSIFGYFVLHRLEVITADGAAADLPGKLRRGALWPEKTTPYVKLVWRWQGKELSQDEIRKRLNERLRRDHVPSIASGKTGKSQPSTARGKTRKGQRSGDEDESIMELIKEIMQELIEEWVEERLEQKLEDRTKGRLKRQLEEPIGGGQRKCFPPEWSTRLEGHRMCSLRKGVGSVYTVDALCAAVHDKYRRLLLPLAGTSGDKEGLLKSIMEENQRLWNRWSQYRKRKKYRWTARDLLGSYGGPFRVAVEEFFDRWTPRYRLDPRLRGKATRYGELVVFDRPFPILERVPRAAFRGIWRIDGDRLIDQIAQHTGRRALIPKIHGCDTRGPVEFFSLGPSYSTQVRAGRVARRLRGEFESRGVVLSAQAEVSRMNDNRWKITDGISSYELEDTGSRMGVSKPAQTRTQDELASWLAQELKVNKACARSFLKLMSQKAREQLVLYDVFRIPGIGTIRVTKEGPPRALRLHPYKAITED
jgi:hypothetical protein